MEDCTDHHELGQDHHHHCRLRCSGIFESLNAQLMAVTSLVSVHLLRVFQRQAEKYPWRLIFYVVVSWVLSSCLVMISVFLVRCMTLGYPFEEFYHPLSHKSELPRIFGMTALPIKAKGSNATSVYWKVIQQLENLMKSKLGWDLVR